MQILHIIITHHQMVLNKLITFLCNWVIPRGHPRINKAPSSSSSSSASYDEVIIIASSDIHHHHLSEGASSSSSSSSTSLSVSSSCSSAVDDSEGESCCVCLSRLLNEEEEEEEEEDIVVLPCLHRFHRTCIDRWFSAWARKTCPLCRFSMEEEEGKFVLHEGEVLTDEMGIWFSSFHVAGF